MNVGELSRITPGVAINLGIFVFSFLCPGFILWYLYDPAQVQSLDFLKLCVLSVAVSSPTFVIPYAVTALLHRLMIIKEVKRIELYGDYVDWYLRHAMTNALNMYTIVIVAFIFELNRLGFIIVFGGAVLVGVLMEFWLMFKFIKDPEGAVAIHFERPRGESTRA